MSSGPIHYNRCPGYTIIEMVVVIILVTLLAAFSIQAVIMSMETYITAARDYLELFKEAQLAMEKMTREIRETDPDSIIVTTGSIAFTKDTDHETPNDPSLAVTFAQSGDVIQRQTGAGNFILVEDVEAASFVANQDENNVVTLSFTVSRGSTNIPVRTAVLPRQP
ncbi:MAG: type II secretion system protein [PVC group bacterium]